MINDFNAEQARANSNEGPQLTYEFLLNELLNAAKLMSLDKHSVAAQEYLTKQLYPSLIEEVTAELEKRNFTVESYPVEDGRKIRFKLSW